jgi:hypothetical protein
MAAVRVASTVIVTTRIDGATGVTAIVARAGIHADAETHHGRRNVNARRGLDVDDARSALDVHHLRRSLDDLRLCLHHLRLRLIDGRRILLDDRRVGHRGRLNDRGRLTVNLLAINRRLVNRRLLRVDRLLRLHGRANQRAGDATDDGAFSPTVTVVTADEATGDCTDNRAVAHGGAKDLRVRRADAGQRDRDSDEECFHFVVKTNARRRVFSQILRPKMENLRNTPTL